MPKKTKRKDWGTHTMVCQQLSPSGTEKTEVWKADDGLSVSLRTYDHKKFKPQHGNPKIGAKFRAETWERWMVRFAVTASIRQGELRVYRITGAKKKKKRSVRNISYDIGGLISFGAVLPVEFVTTVCEMLKVEHKEHYRLAHLVMPMLQSITQFQAGSGEKLCAQVGRALRTDDPRTAAENIFGKKTKPHVKTLLTWLEEQWFDCMTVARGAQGLVPHERLDVIQHAKGRYAGTDGIKCDAVRLVLTPLTEHSRKRVISSEWTGVTVRDTLQMLDLPEKGAQARKLRMAQASRLLRGQMPGTWDQYHDRLTNEMNRHKDELDNQEIPLIPLAKEIQGGMTKAGRVILVATETLQLSQWGRALRHCIASYKRQALEGSSVLFAVMEHGENGTELRATGELSSSKSLRQLYGLQNQRQSAEFHEDVEEYLKETLKVETLGRDSPF